MTIIKKGIDIQKMTEGPNSCYEWEDDGGGGGCLSDGYPNPCTGCPNRNV